jgi:hypothetical protein
MMCYFGNFNVRCLDHGDGVAKMHAWWGLISKGEYMRTKLVGEEVVVEKGLGDTPFPPEDMVLKVIHAGGGNIPNKMQYHKWFANEDVIKYIDYLVSDTKPEYKMEKNIIVQKA